MQLFIFSPIFILMLFYKGIVGLLFMVLCVVAFTITTGVATFNNGYMAATYANPRVLDQLQWLYNQPFYRANPYLIGILLGYILYKKYSIADLPIKKSLQNQLCILLWIIAIYLCKTTLFGTIEEYNGTHHFTKWENVIFLMFSGLAWSIGISIIFFGNTGYGGVVNSVLSGLAWMGSIRQVILWGILVTCTSNLLYTRLPSIKFDIYRHCVYHVLCVYNSIVIQLVCSIDTDCGVTYIKNSITLFQNGWNRKSL